MTRIRSRHHRRQPPLVDPRRDVLRAVHDHARQHGRERRAAVDPAGPRTRRSRGLEWTVNAYTLTLRRAARHRRAPRRHLRPPAHVPLRRRRLRRSRAPSSASRRARRGWSPVAPSRASAPRFMMPATLSIITNAFPPARARQGDRHLGRRQRPGAGHRPGGRRLPGRERLLAVDLLPQRAGRRRWPSSSRCPPRASRATRRSPPTSTSPASPPITVGLSALVLALVEGNSWGWGSPRIVALLAIVGRRAGRLRARRAARRRADGRLPFLPLALVRRREPRRLHRELRDARDVLLPRPLHAEHQGLLAARRPACASCPRRW